MKHRLKKHFISILIILAMILPCYQANSATNLHVAKIALSEKISEGEMFLASQVKNAILSSSKTRAQTSILNSISKPTSFDISIPKIDSSKIISEYDPLLSSLKEREVFYDELKKHGIEDNNITYSEYNALESSWNMSTETIELMKLLNPELKDVDLSNWTILDKQEYEKAQSIKNLKNRFSNEQLIELSDRGILLEDTFYLFKEFHTVDAILSKTDAELKRVIEDYYIFNLEAILGEGSFAELESKKTYATKSMDNRRYTIPSNVANHYQWVNFPLYGGDYFHLDALTNDYWRTIQAYRTLYTEAFIYGKLYNYTNVMNCSNLYGTYSQHSGGAHEGIDFCDSSRTAVYSPVEGVRVSGGAYHQVAIYDANHTDGAKTYSFLHMTNILNYNSYSVLTRMGTQGAEGNANGIHVHFEVHSGRTTSLSTGSDQSLDSLSPYRLTEYLGEAPTPDNPTPNV